MSGGRGALGGRIAYAAARRFFASPLYDLMLGGARAKQPGPSPAEAVPAVPGLGEAILHGAFPLAGRSVPVGESLWAAARKEGPWAEAFHGFAWLDGLQAVGTDSARRAAREHTGAWIARHRRWDHIAWRADLLAERVCHWLAAAEFLALDHDPGFAAAMAESLARQLRHLGRVAPGRRDGMPRIVAARALVAGGLALPELGSLTQRGIELLAAEVARQVLPDGGHVERSPAAQLAALRHLVAVRAALHFARRETPQHLQSAIDRAAPALRFFRHGDGRLALFNGSGESDPQFLERVLGDAEAPGRPPDSLPQCGFHRLAAKRTLVLCDGGAPPPAGLDGAAHAGALSFELSQGKERLVVNCGTPPGGAAGLADAARATAAHSTLVLRDTNSSEITPGGGLGRRPAAVAAERRQVEGAQLVEMHHDGYVPGFGAEHRRSLYLSAAGDDLRGEDRLTGVAEHEVALRFHLHPEVRASLLGDGEGVLLRLPSGGGWRFRTTAGRPALEESVYFGGCQARHAEQIVVRARSGGPHPPLRWAFRRVDAG